MGGDMDIPMVIALAFMGFVVALGMSDRCELTLED